MKISTVFLVFVLLMTTKVCLNLKKICAQSTDKKNVLYDESGYSPYLRAIMDKTNIQADGTLEDLIRQTQKSQADGGWLRPQGLERWELPTTDSDETVWYANVFKNMGFMDAVMPSKQSYTYGVIFGATIQGMRERFAHLINLMKHEDIEIKTIVFLVGQRPRDDKKENLDVLFKEQIPNIPFKKDWQPSQNIPQTETELARLIIEQSDIDKSIKERIIIIDTPMITKSDGTVTRPITDDTVHTWLSKHPEKGSVLCISSQPYVHRQGHVARRLLPSDWDVECVGSAASHTNMTPSLILDTLARDLYELSKS